VERLFSEFFTTETAKKAGVVSREGDADPQITGLEYDSRNVKQGSLFFALSGLHTNGSLFIEDAISRGAVCVVHENEDIKKTTGIVYVKVRNSRFAMSPIAASFYNFPSRRVLVTGVTGTEGKSTTVYFIWQLLSLAGKKAGFFSTVQRSFGGGAVWNSEHQTTPEAPVVQQLIREMADNGCEYAVVEASSHGLSPKTNRLGDVNFCSAVFTNVTHEHLEFHGTWEQYRDDKANLFRALDKYIPVNSHDGFKPFGVINADDKSARFFAQAAKSKTFTFSCHGNEADITAETVENGARGNSYRVFEKQSKENIEINDNLPGSFNAGNVLAAILTVSNLLNVPVCEIAPFVSELKPVRGRMTSVNKGQPFELVVDYAHTPSSFMAIFPPLRTRLDKTGGRIISLFGSAGERDTQKRAEQGKIAARYSDFIVITDEDPRGEKPMDILEEIAKGVETDAESGKDFAREKNLFLITDRPRAVRKAISLARGGDLVLLLGKGHENSIIYADHVMPYDEIAEAEKALGE
jgi:UDP-N-acetylmuramoyl-L-alanyl-D-glutamate--2,6-diaminopimelate ligase